jgi:transposase
MRSSWTWQRKHGYSRDKQFDFVQVAIALVATPEGLPLDYEVMDGNTSPQPTLNGSEIPAVIVASAH